VSVSQAGAGRTVPGVIDTIGTAYAMLNRQPYLIMVLVALDLVYWLGPRLSPIAFTARVAEWLGRAGADPQAQGLLRDLGTQFDNLLMLLSVLIPTLVFALGVDRLPQLPALTWNVEVPWWLVPPLALTLAALGVLVGMGYLTMLGRLVRGHAVISPELPRAALRNGLAMIGLYLILIGLFVLVLMPAMITSVLSVVIGIDALILPIVSLFLFALSLWAFLLTFFVEEAIVLSQAGPLRALYLSYHLLRSHFWQAVRFIVAVMIIQTGAPIALSLFTRTPWGVPFALVSYAYLITGLGLASMIFYRDRVAVVLAQQASRAASSE